MRYTPSKIIKKGSVTLECMAEYPGKPDNVTYLWYRGGHLVREINVPNWTINYVTLETRNNFTCVAINEGGRSKESSVAIDVVGKVFSNN